MSMMKFPLTLKYSKKRLNFSVVVIEDDHRIKLTKKLMKELGEDVAGAVCAHSAIEGNAVECEVWEDVTPEISA